MKFATKNDLIAIGIILPLIILFYMKLMSNNSYIIETARFRATRAKMARAETAIETYRIHIQKYPDKLEDLIMCPVGLESIWQGPYLKESQLLDPWDRPFIYKLDPNGYSLKSYGEDGKPGGEGYDADIYND